MKNLSVQAANKHPINEAIADPGGCAHSRLVDEVCSPNGLKAGKIRCLECDAILDDPYVKEK